jgi:hypothetical protein
LCTFLDVVRLRPETGAFHKTAASRHSHHNKRHEQKHLTTTNTSHNAGQEALPVDNAITQGCGPTFTAKQRLRVQRSDLPKKKKALLDTLTRPAAGRAHMPRKLRSLTSTTRQMTAHQCRPLSQFKLHCLVSTLSQRLPSDPWSEFPKRHFSTHTSTQTPTITPLSATATRQTASSNTARSVQTLAMQASHKPARLHGAGCSTCPALRRLSGRSGTSAQFPATTALCVTSTS